MKIRLIEPKAAGLNVFDQAKLPRLGLPLIGRLLADLGHDVRIYVETLAPVDWTDVGNADLVGFSALTTTAPVAYGLAGQIRQLGIPTVIGGPHVTFLADEALDHCNYVVRGEGQMTMLELASALQAGPQADLGGIAGLSYRDAAGNKRHNPARPMCSRAEFAALPAPDLKLIVGYEHMTNVPIMTQWGCPFDCDFCGVIRMFGRLVRARPVEAVLDELELYREFGGVFFYDDNFIVDKARTKALLRGILERGLALSWSAQMRAEAVYKDARTGELDDELLSLMRDSGCATVYCGFESVNPLTLEAYNKHQSVATIRDSIRAFHAYDIKVHGMFVLGADSDDAATVAQTADFALQNKIDTVQFLMLTPSPGTSFTERMTAEGRVLTHDWSLYDGHYCVIQPARMSPYELQIATYKAMARFYSASHALRMIADGLRRNAGFLLGLLAREHRLGFHLPRIALLSFFPSRWPDILLLAQRVLRHENWQRVERIFGVPVLRLYGRNHIRQWARQAHARAYMEFLRRLMPPHQSASTP